MPKIIKSGINYIPEQVQPDENTIIVNSEGKLEAQFGKVPNANWLAIENSEGFILNKPSLLKGSYTDGKAVIINDINNIASGEMSVAEGKETQAIGNKGSHAEGYMTQANGESAHAEGYGSIANGDGSHAEGVGTITSTAPGTHVQGRYNANYTNTNLVDVVGWGNDNNTRKNISALTADGRLILKNGITIGADDQSQGGYTIPVPITPTPGTYYTPTLFNGNITWNATGSTKSPDWLVQEGSEGYIANKPNIIAGSDSSKSAVIINDKANNRAAGQYSVVEGSGTSTTSQAWYSHAEGKDTSVTARYGHAEGIETIVSGQAGHAEGYSTQANGLYSHAEGNSTSVDIDVEAGHAEGINTSVNGSYSHAEGQNTSISIEGGHVEGIGTINAGIDGAHVQGKYNVSDSVGRYADIVGWGTSSSNRKNISALTTTGNQILAGTVTIGAANNSTGGYSIPIPNGLDPDLTYILKFNGSTMSWEIDEAAAADNTTIGYTDDGKLEVIRKIYDGTTEPSASLGKPGDIYFKHN